MSTYYITQEPTTLVEFVAIVSECGVPASAEEFVCADGLTRVMFTRYGASSVNEVIDLVPCFSEYDAEYKVLLFGPDDDCEENI